MLPTPDCFARWETNRGGLKATLRGGGELPKASELTLAIPIQQELIGGHVAYIHGNLLQAAIRLNLRYYISTISSVTGRRRERMMPAVDDLNNVITGVSGDIYKADQSISLIDQCIFRPKMNTHSGSL